MKSFKGVNIPVSDEEAIFLSHLLDLVALCEKRFSPQFTLFADERKLMLAQKLFAGEAFSNYRFFGGCADAERKIICVYPEYNEPTDSDFPIKTVKFSYRKQDKITHPQILGTIMSLGIKRELVGDIIVSDGEAFVFFSEKGAFLACGIEKIGRVGVKAEITENTGLERQEEFTEISASVASMRLDCILSAAAKLSREKSSALIKNEGIFVNHVNIFSPNHILKDGDVFSVRGKGKFILSDKNERSRRGKNFIVLKKYKN